MAESSKRDPSPEVEQENRGGEQGVLLVGMGPLGAKYVPTPGMPPRTLPLLRIKLCFIAAHGGGDRAIATFCTLDPCPGRLGPRWLGTLRLPGRNLGDTASRRCVRQHRSVSLANVPDAFYSEVEVCCYSEGEVAGEGSRLCPPKPSPARGPAIANDIGGIGAIAAHHLAHPIFHVCVCSLIPSVSS